MKDKPFSPKTKSSINITFKRSERFKLRRYGKACYPLKGKIRLGKRQELLKRLKPQKLLKLFCPTTPIRAILHGQDGIERFFAVID